MEDRSNEPTAYTAGGTIISGHMIEPYENEEIILTGPDPLSTNSGINERIASLKK